MDPIQAQYLFVNTTGERKAHNDPRRRSHVMQNRLEARGYELASIKTKNSLQASSLASGKISFRLHRNGMERRYPHRSKRKPPGGPASDASQDYSTNSAFFMQNGLKGEGTSPASCTGTQSPCQGDMQRLLSPPPSPQLLSGVARIDPFGVLPIELRPWDEILLNRFFHHTKYPWCPINGQSSWSSFALSDKLVLHATMYAWSMSFCDKIAEPQASSWLEDNPEILQHKLSTISLIKTRLADSDHVIKDETVAAVAVMTFMELMYGNQETAAKHMDGLRTLLNMRGGFNTFVTATQLLLQRLICWTDLVYSEFSGTSLIFPPARIWDVSWRTLDKWRLPSSSLGLSLSDLQAAAVPYHDVIKILHATRRLCHEEKERPLSKLEEHQRMQRGDMFLKIERSLRVIIQRTDSPSSDYWNDTVWQAVTLATLMFVHHFLRGSPLSHRQFRVLGAQLQEALSRMSGSLQELAFNRSLLFWVLSVGAVTSAETPYRTWFIRKLAEISTKYSVGWQELRILLMDFLWTGLADDQRYFRMWRMVEAGVPDCS